MPTTYASGAAYVDASGDLSAADPGFLETLGLPSEGAAAALRERAAASPALRALLAGAGPEMAKVAGAQGVAVELVRCRGEGGLLLLARSARLQERLEHGLRSPVLSRLVAGVVHDVKNPLNAMSLQLAILSEKLGAAIGVAGPHLGALRDQVGRVNEVLRRFLEVSDPGAPMGYTDLGALLQDGSALLVHEARRRRVELAVEIQRGGVRTSCEPARAGRLLLVLVAGALASTPDGGRVELALGTEAGQAVLRLAHAVGLDDGAAAEDLELGAAAARALGGEVVAERDGGVRRVVLRLPGVERP
jgi:signal transduction histidine kinase